MVDLFMGQSLNKLKSSWHVWYKKTIVKKPLNPSLISKCHFGFQRVLIHQTMPSQLVISQWIFQSTHGHANSGCMNWFYVKWFHIWACFFLWKVGVGVYIQFLSWVLFSIGSSNGGASYMFPTPPFPQLFSELLGYPQSKY